MYLCVHFALLYAEICAIVLNLQANNANLATISVKLWLLLFFWFIAMHTCRILAPFV